MAPHDRLSPARLVAIGRTSRVYRWADDLVAKVLNPGVPSEWAELEASFTNAVRHLGVAAPEVRDVTTIDGAPTILFGLVDGPSLWSVIRDRSHETTQMVSLLVETQRSIQSAGTPDGLPSLVSRLEIKLRDSPELGVDERNVAFDLLAGVPNGAALLHGDLHPGNVLLGPDGPVVIDWFDATVGHPSGDLERTALLLRASGATDLRHLPGATVSLVNKVERSYLEQSGLADRTDEERRPWKRLMAASRLSERTDADTAGLVDLWRRG